MDKSTNFNITSSLAAWILYIVNFIVMFACILLFVFGLWIITSPVTLSTAVEASGSDTLKALLQDMLTLKVGIAITAIATFVFFVCFMGFYGAITRSPFLLFMYAALVLLLLLLECALLYYFSSNFVEKGLQDDGQWTHALRLFFKCCEINSTLAEERSLPWSCCGPETYPNNCTSTDTYRKDCRKTITGWLERYMSPIYSSLSVIHIILASCSILRRSCCPFRSHS